MHPKALLRPLATICSEVTTPNSQMVRKGSMPSHVYIIAIPESFLTNFPYWLSHMCFPTCSNHAAKDTENQRFGGFQTSLL